MRQARGIPGGFAVADGNAGELPAGRYGLIFSCHSFHHFLRLEHIMERVHRALTPSGFFVLEEYVGPTQFQWTDEQIALVRALMALVPERLRRLRWDAVKTYEGQLGWKARSYCSVEAPEGSRYAHVRALDPVEKQDPALVRQRPYDRKTNNDEDDHTVVSDDAFNTAGNKGVNRLLPADGGTVVLQFTHPGTFVYYCRFHAHLDSFNQPVAPGPEGGIQDANGNFGTPMMGVITVLPDDD